MSSRRFHIVIDAVNVSKDKLSDESFIMELMIKIKDAINMNFLVWPKVVDGTLENPGITAFAIIDFSHISIHTFTATKELCLDIFSCKKFDYLELYKLVKKELKVEDKDINRAVVNYNNLPKL